MSTQELMFGHIVCTPPLCEDSSSQSVTHISQKNIFKHVQSGKSTIMRSGPICLISLQQITWSVSQEKNDFHLAPPGTISLQMQPVHWSNSKSVTCPSFLQSLKFMTSLHFSSEKSISVSLPHDAFSLLLLAYAPHFLLLLFICCKLRPGIS